MEVKAVSAASQPGWNQCGDRNGGCTHLCFYLPTGRRCACPDILDGRGCSDRECPTSDTCVDCVLKAFILCLFKSIFFFLAHFQPLFHCLFNFMKLFF